MNPLEKENKWIVVLRAKKNHKINNEYLGEFENEILNIVTGNYASLEVSKIKVCITEEVPPSLNLFKFEKSAIALLHIYSDLNIGFEIEEATRALDFTFDIYEVSEKIALDNRLPLKNGQRTKVPYAVTLLRKRKDMSTSEFRSFWHNQYTPHAKSIIPLNVYLKNEVNKIIAGKSEAVDGIVEETCSTKKELLNPVKFFGGSLLKLIPNLFEVYKKVNQFLDLKKIEVYYMHEYFIIVS